MSAGDLAALQRELETLGRRVARDLGKLVASRVRGDDVRSLHLHGTELEELARIALLYRAIESRYVRAIDLLEQAKDR